MSYCKDSFTYSIYKSFAKGLEEKGHEIVVSDLYEMGFTTHWNEAVSEQNVSKHIEAAYHLGKEF